MRRSSALPLVISALLALCFALPTIAPAATQSELQDAQREAAAAREAAAEEDEKASALTDQIADLDGVIAVTGAELDHLRGQIAEVTARRQRLETEIASLERDISNKQSEIVTTEADLEHRRDVLSERVRIAYKQGDWYLLELLLEAKSLNDLMNRTSYAQMVIAHDERIAAELVGTRASLRHQKAQLDRDLGELEAKRAEVLAEETRIASLKQQEGAKLSSQESARGEKKTLLAETEANADRLRELAEAEEAESRRIAAELRAGSSSGSGQYNGVMSWPVPGFTRITSSYGWRLHPILGTQKLHTGIDIGRAHDGTSIDGATVVAAGDGTVVFAGWKGGYGNTIMIDHGDGVSTLYGHLRSGGILVSNGQAVSKGSSIGRVGSTGYSTGPHLHFEARVNGDPVDPMSYLR